MATGRQTMEFDYHVGGVKTVAVAPDGSWLAASHRIWDVATGEQLEEVPVAEPKAERARIVRVGSQLVTEHSLTAAAVTPDGRWLATVGRDMTIRVLEKATGLALTAMCVDGPPYSCTWTPDGSGLVVGGHRGLYFFDFCPGANGA